MTASDEHLGHAHGRPRTECQAVLTTDGWRPGGWTGMFDDCEASGSGCGKAGCKASVEYKTFHLVNFM